MQAKVVPFTTLKNPVHFLALGLGTGCSPWTPGAIDQQHRPRS